MDYPRLNMRKSGLFIGCIYFLALAVTRSRQQDNFYFDPAPRDQDAVEGSNVRLRCDVSNRRHIVFYWTLGDNDRQLGNGSRRYQDDSNLYIRRVDRTLDAGGFRCVATNVTTGVSRISTEAQINILWISKTASVQLRSPKEASDISAGIDLVLKCHAEGNPEPSYEWYRNTIRLFSNEKIKFHRNKLKITSISAGDNGVYSCKAKNSAGTRSSDDNFLLNVAEKSAAKLNAATFTKRLLVKAYGRAQFDCQYENSIITEWYFRENRLTNTSRTVIYPNGTLVILRVQRDDAGAYRCVGISESGPAQTFAAKLLLAYLNPIKASSFEPKVPNNRPKVVAISHSYQVRCLTPKGLPQPVQRWQNPANEVIGPESGRITSNGEMLYITNALPEDTGNYTCVASNMAGEQSRSVWIVVSVPPVISRPPQSTRVEEEETGVFKCSMDGTPYPVSMITWQREGKPLKALQSRFVVDPQRGTLTIHKVQLSDEANYACVVNTTGHPPVISNNAHIYVKKKLKFRPPPVNSRLELGSRSKLHCKADGQATPTIRWLRGRGTHIQGEDKLPPHVAASRGTLLFDGVKQGDAGSYTCVATSSQGLINKTIIVEVVVKPQFKVKPSNTTVHEGNPITIHCLAEGDPKPTIQWDKDSKANNIDLHRFKVLRNGSLYVSEVYMEDMGFYGCTAGNSGGFEREEIYLHVSSAGAYSNTGSSESFNMMKTITIAVCSAVAYLAVVIGLTVYCSVRLMRAKNQRKRDIALGENTQLHPEKFENGAVPNEHTELMEQHDSSVLKGSGGGGSGVCGNGGCGSGGGGSGIYGNGGSGGGGSGVCGNGGCGSGGGWSGAGDDTRSHMSGVSSQPSHSSHSARSRSAYDRLSFPRHDLQTLRMLGKGHYGDVFLAKAHGICDGEPETVVVVKSLLARDDFYVRDFRHEIDMYARLQHAYIARLLGICCQMEPQFIISEYTDWGDLKQYLWASRDDTATINSPPPLTIAQSLSMCRQLAVALAHLTESRLVHGDVATRNVLLTSRLDIKLCSPGPVRDGPYARDYPAVNGRPAPLRWLAPEAARRGERTMYTDVWAYGVFIWELLTCADLPYAEHADSEVLRALCTPTPTTTNLRLETPASAPPSVLALVHRCTADMPHERPTFADIVTSLGEITVDSGV